MIGEKGKKRDLGVELPRNILKAMLITLPINVTNIFPASQSYQKRDEEKRRVETLLRYFVSLKCHKFAD